MFKLLRYFSITSAVAIIGVTSALAFLYWQNAVDNLTRQIENQNVELARSFANVIWPKYANFVKSVSGLNGEALRRRPETREIHENLKSMIVGLPVLKVKMYDLQGLTVYSTDPTQIGHSDAKNVRFNNTVRRNIPSSQKSFRKLFQSIDGTVANRDLIESYLPITGANGRSEGVFELYTDVTRQVAGIYRNTTVVVIYLLLGLGLLYSILFLIVGRADRVMRQQYLDLKHEVAERQSAELRYKAAKDSAEEANQAKTKFLASMSHELRTPLNAIIGFSQVWMGEVFGPVHNAKYMEYARDINSASTHLLEIITDILDLARIEAGESRLEEEVLTFNAVIASCISMLRQRAKSQGIDLSYSPAQPVARLYADRRMMKQILINIVGNSLKFTPAGGSVNITVDVLPDKSSRLTVRDSGIGIPPDQIATALEPFGQVRDDTPLTAHEGTGLGLPLTRDMVETHGGTLDITSAVGQGTAVILTFPPERTR